MLQSQQANSLIQGLVDRKAQIDARLTSLDARRSLSQKKAEDRLKWLLGTLVFDRLRTDPELQELVRRHLPERLSQRDRDRGLWQMLFPDTKEDRS